MSDALDKEKLLALVEYAFGEAMCVQERKVEPQDLNQAYKQIEAIIGASKEVTEEWIEKKSKELHDKIWPQEAKLCAGTCKRTTEIKEFIRTLVEEIHGRK